MKRSASMQRVLLLLSLFLIITVNSAFVDSETPKSNNLPWNSPEIFSKWFKPSVPNLGLFDLLPIEYPTMIYTEGNQNYKSELLLFIELALGDYLKTPNFADNGAKASILFRHFGGDAMLQLKEEKVNDFIKLRLENEFKARNLRDTLSHLGGYAVGRADAPPSWVLDHYILGPGKFLPGSDAEYEEFERVEESNFEDDVKKIIGSVVDFHLMTPLASKAFENLAKRMDPPAGAPGNMITRLTYKKWDPTIAWSVYKWTGFYPQNLLYILNMFYDVLADGTVVVLYGLENQDPNPIGPGEVYQNNGAYVLKPIRVTKYGQEYIYTAVYNLWFFQGQNYEVLGDKIDEYLFPNSGWKTNVVTTDVRRMRTHLEAYPLGSAASEINPF